MCKQYLLLKVHKYGIFLVHIAFVFHQGSEGTSVQDHRCCWLYLTFFFFAVLELDISHNVYLK